MKVNVTVALALSLVTLMLLAQDARRPNLANDNEWAQIPAGTFLMGSSNGGDNERPVHRVMISRGFEMGKYEVTQAQWQAVMGTNSSQFKGVNFPVEQVSWEDAQSFIQSMNSKNDGYMYRLPTDAEWEYAARAGTTRDYGGTGNLDEMGWYERNSSGKTHPVGVKKPNGWGLYDMHGNVWEWVQDWYDKDYYNNSPTTDPRGPSTGNAAFAGAAPGVTPPIARRRQAGPIPHRMPARTS